MPRIFIAEESEGSKYVLMLASDPLRRSFSEARRHRQQGVSTLYFQASAGKEGYCIAVKIKSREKIKTLQFLCDSRETAGPWLVAYGD